MRRMAPVGVVLLAFACNAATPAQDPTLSPAVALAPGGKLTHVHQTLHFVGPHDALEKIAQQVLGASLAGL